MKLIIDKFILIVDLEGGECYNKIIFTSENDVEIDIYFGPPKTIIDPAMWEFHDFKTINEPLFPLDRINPLLVEGLTDKTIIGIMINNNRILINTTFSQDILYKDVIYIPKHESLLYLFAYIPKIMLTISPSIAVDNIGAIYKLGTNNKDNILRKKIIDLLNYASIPASYLGRIDRDAVSSSISQEELNQVVSIKVNDLRFIIVYKGLQYTINIDKSLLDTFTILYKNVNTNDQDTINELWHKIRVKEKNKCDKTHDHFESFLKNFNRAIKTIEEYENRNEYDPKDGLSKFLKNTIEISRADYSISCSITSDIKIEVSPPEFFD